MNPIRFETTIERDGELHLTGIPCHKGDKVEAVVRVIENQLDEVQRRKALAQLLDHARSSNFVSTKPYPKREELYDRF